LTTMHHDWIEEIESEPSAPARRSGLALGVPIVAAALGIALGAIGASMWWAPRGGAAPSVVEQPAAKAPAPATLASVAPTAAPAVQITPATAASAATPDVVAATPPVEPQTPITLPPPAAGPPALSPEEVARRKERAWARFYKRPAACEGNPSADQLIECGNHFIRSKREFDERWRTGTL
jgi:hypothetical protein